MKNFGLNQKIEGKNMMQSKKLKLNAGNSPFQF